MKSIYISRTNLPSLEDYNKYLKKIWKSNWLTNNGELVQLLEKKLQKYWGVKHVICVDHGTSAIIIALKALGIKKEVYLSPYSFIATASAPVFLGIKLKFVDLNEEYKGPALVTHLYGLPQIIPDRNKVRPIIYDASHAFTTKYNKKSVLAYGDVSAISFNAVKIFQTAEGGTVVTNNDEIASKARWMRNFGFKDRYSFQGTGINCKMSEFHAAMGLCVLPLVNKMRKRYNQIIEKYNKELGLNVDSQVTYYPVWYSSEEAVLKAIKKFEENRIFPRRYFYPPLNKVFGGKTCPDVEGFMNRVLCLPLYHELTEKDQNRVIKVAKETL